MQEQLQTIASLLDKHEIKKAEILIAKHLRVDLTDSQHAEILLYRARTRLLGARPSEALDDLTHAQSLQGNEFAATAANLELLADCYFARYELSSVGFADKGDATQAESLYEQILDLFPDYPNRGWIYYQWGRVLLTNNQVEKALEKFHQALFNPSHETLLTAYCYERMGFVAFYEERNLDQALTLLDKAIDTYPASEERSWLVQVHILKSRVLREMGRYEAALYEAETSLEIATHNRNEEKMAFAEALLTVGELLAKLEGREKDIITYLRQFLQVSKRPLGVDVTWSRVHEMLGDALFKSSQYEEAINAYFAALGFNPYHPWEISVYYRIARSFYHKQDYKKAVDAVNQIFESAKTEKQEVSDYRIYGVLGNAQFALENYAEAAEAYQTALRLAPPNAEDIDKVKTYYEYALELC